MLEWYLPDRGAELSDDLRAEFVTMWRDLLAQARGRAAEPGCCATFIRPI